MNKLFVNNYDSIISIENLLESWQEFVKGKRKRKDVQEFERNLMSNILLLQQDLKNQNYHHAPYKAFKISDPKPRDIHKAGVRDRLLHRAIYRKLYQFFDQVFISDSYSCRLAKGTHKALNRFRNFANKVSKNHTKTIWILKCDVRKFFASIDQQVLMKIIGGYIADQDIVLLLRSVVSSFYFKKEGIGLPLGNLTSQLLVNIYMNEFDKFIKQELKVKYYIRYADDFVILSQDKKWLEDILLKIKEFLHIKLKLELHPNKVSIKALASGIDFLGWVNFADHRVLRTATKKRMIRRLILNSSSSTINSYLGLLGHGNTFKIRTKLI